MARSARGSVAFDLKSTTLSGLALVLRTDDLTLLGRDMGERFGATPGAFHHDPVVIDLSGLPQDAAPLDFDGLLSLLTGHRLRAAGARGGSAAAMAAASAAGLCDLGEDAAPAPRDAPPAVARDDLPEAEAPAVSAPAEPMTGTVSVSARAGAAPTLIVDKPLRSGQQVYAKGGDLVVLATVNVGAEVIADGSIHVYGPLRGKAVAGAKGNAEARIFSTCMEPQLLAIAGTYRTTETPLPTQVLGKAAQIRLEGERLVFEPLD